MSENTFQIILKTYDTIVHSVQTHLSNFIGNHERRGNLFPTSIHKATSDSTPIQRKEQSSDSNSFVKGRTAKPLTKEELGRATWTVLHSIAAQYPDHPTRQQKKDAKELICIKIILIKNSEDKYAWARALLGWVPSWEFLVLPPWGPFMFNTNRKSWTQVTNPVQEGSQAEFSQWVCHIHNVVNRSLGKVTFPCQRMDARWGKLECEDRECDVEGTSPS